MLTSNQTRRFREDGYLVVEGVLPTDLLREVREAARSLTAVLPATIDRRVWHERALFRRPAFRRLLDVEALIFGARDLIGQDVQLLALDLLFTRAGKGEVGWHRDVTFICNETLSMNTGIYLQDMTEEMGPLRVVPGSHRSEENPPPGPAMPGEVSVPVPAGAAVFFDAGLWHTGGVNRSSVDRLAVFPYFGRYWVKRMDNYFTQPLPADLLHAEDPMKRQLLGLGLRSGVSSYHGDDESYNRRGEPGLDFQSTEAAREGGG